jgi:hypothetical protein
MVNEARVDLTHISPTARIARLTQEFEGIPDGAQVLILALPNPKEPTFEVEWEGRVRVIPIAYFRWASLSYEISGLFEDWRPS